MKDTKITLKYVLAVTVAVLFTWISHEFIHWLTSEILGYKAIMQLNVSSVVRGENPTELHKAIISISGPIITILQGLLAFFILEYRHWNKYIYPFLFTTFYMRLLAGMMNFINVNDEGRVGQYLGIGTFTLSIMISALLFFMVYKVSKKYSLGWKFQLFTYLIVMVASSMLIMADQIFHIRLL